MEVRGRVEGLVEERRTTKRNTYICTLHLNKAETSVTRLR